MSQRDPIRRVLQVHTRYRLAGGEDQVVEAEKALLEDAGVEVPQVIFDNADIRESRSVAGDLELAASAIWSRAAQRRVSTAIAGSDPQVVHVHNTFPAASPSVYAAAAASGIPVIQTLHNYRFVCPSATVFRDGHACTDCVGRSIPWPAVLHACVRDSRPQSLVSAATLTFHRARGTFNGINAFIALTSFQRDVMIRGGLPADRIRVIPNFLEPDPGIGRGERNGVVFAGRLSAEKGVAGLVEAASTVRGVIRIVGDGPLAALVEGAASAGEIAYLGPLPHSAVLDELRRAIAVVVPSIWFEGLPLVVLEAFASGTPVIASRIGSLAELIEEGVTGLLAEPEDGADLADRIRWAVGHAHEMAGMGLSARRSYEKRFRGQAHLESLQDAYAWAGGGRERSNGTNGANLT
jgi:glycosyltransferase involved in cell wall biosynthesis